MDSEPRKFDYDDAESTLEVIFQNGHVYQYYHVPSHVYSSLVSNTSAETKESYFNAHIKNSFRRRQVR